MGLILGRSSLNAQGERIHTEVIDVDFIGEIQILVSSSIPWNVEPGKRIAQLLVNTI